MISESIWLLSEKQSIYSQFYFTIYVFYSYSICAFPILIYVCICSNLILISWMLSTAQTFQIWYCIQHLKLWDCCAYFTYNSINVMKIILDKWFLYMFGTMSHPSQSGNFYALSQLRGTINNTTASNEAQCWYGQHSYLMPYRVNFLLLTLFHNIDIPSQSNICWLKRPFGFI